MVKNKNFVGELVASGGLLKTLNDREPKEGRTSPSIDCADYERRHPIFSRYRRFLKEKHKQRVNTCYAVLAAYSDM